MLGIPKGLLESTEICFKNLGMCSVPECMQSMLRPWGDTQCPKKTKSWPPSFPNSHR